MEGGDVRNVWGRLDDAMLDQRMRKLAGRRSVSLDSSRLGVLLMSF